MAREHLTQRDMLFRLYDRVLGNGGQNMSSQLAELWESRHSYVTKKECTATREATTSKRRSTWLIVKDIVLLLFGAGSAIVAYSAVARLLGAAR